MKKEMLFAVRDGKIALNLAKYEIKADGTIWTQGMPVLGITSLNEKTKMVPLIKAKKFAQIPAEYFTRLGDNQNGLWVGTAEEWRKHPAKIEADKKEAEREARKARCVTVYLSSRGWGDFSPLTWYGDITRPDVDILAECQKLLKRGDDIDHPNQSDEDILGKIHKAREDLEAEPARRAAREAAEAEDIRRKVATGYCFNCGTWCHGDCGNYSNDPGIEWRRELREAAREASFGINEEG